MKTTETNLLVEYQQGFTLYHRVYIVDLTLMLFSNGDFYCRMVKSILTQGLKNTKALHVKISYFLSFYLFNRSKSVQISFVSVDLKFYLRLVPMKGKVSQGKYVGVRQDVRSPMIGLDEYWYMICLGC